MTPFFFGPSGSLFGVYHEPSGGRPRRTAAVLCYPAGHEYLRVQRSFVNLATRLSRAGLPVFRFDYSGTGDSAGSGSDATLGAWSEDLRCAIAEVQRRSGATRLALAGLRIGGALAWREALARNDVDVMLLWDPVLRGGAYVRQVRALEARWLSEPVRGASPAAEIAAGSLLGFPLGRAMEHELEQLDLTAGPLPRVGRIFAMMASDDPKEAAWCERLRAAHGANCCAVVPGGIAWDDPGAIHTAVYPQGALKVIATAFDALAA